MFDVIALHTSGVRGIQVKAGKRPYLPPIEREQLQLVAKELQPSVTVELWKWRDYAREPEIEVLK